MERQSWKLFSPAPVFVYITEFLQFDTHAMYKKVKVSMHILKQ